MDHGVSVPALPLFINAVFTVGLHVVMVGVCVCVCPMTDAINEYK